MSIISFSQTNEPVYTFGYTINHEAIDQVCVRKDGIYNIRYIRGGTLCSATGTVDGVVAVYDDKCNKIISQDMSYILFDPSDECSNRKERIYFYQISTIEDVTPDNAYILALKHGFVGTIEDWLEAQRGPEGYSAYEIAKQNGFPGTEKQWLCSLKGHMQTYMYDTYEEAVEKITDPIPGDILLCNPTTKEEEGVFLSPSKEMYFYNDDNWTQITVEQTAENTIFTSDLESNCSIGAITVDPGEKVTIPSRGKSLAEVIDWIINLGELPKVTQPSITITTNAKEEYETGKRLDIDYEITIDKGSYSYGPEDTGVHLTSGHLSDNQEHNVDLSPEHLYGTLSDVVIKDEDYEITLTAALSGGVSPYTDKGQPYKDLAIQPNEECTANVLIKHYRPTYYGVGSVEGKDVQTSEIRKMTKTETWSKVGDEYTIHADIDSGKSIIFAIPKSLLTEVNPVITRSDLEPVEGDKAFKMIVAKIAGLDNHQVVEYRIYYYDLIDGDYGKTFTVTIAAKE